MKQHKYFSNNKRSSFYEEKQKNHIYLKLLMLLFLLVGIYFIIFYIKEFKNTTQQTIIPTKFEFLLDTSLMLHLNNQKNNEYIYQNLIIDKFYENNQIINKPKSIKINWLKNIFTSFVEHIHLKFINNQLINSYFADKT